MLAQELGRNRTDNALSHALSFYFFLCLSLALALDLSFTFALTLSLGQCKAAYGRDATAD